MSKLPYHELLCERGISLELIGIHGSALSRADALEAVELLRTASVPIFGGDVLIRIGATIELTYDNWHFSKGVMTEQEYVQKSCAEADAYIRKYPILARGEVLFQLVER